MHRKPSSVWHIFIGISGLSVLGWFINSYSPDSFLMITLFFLIIAVTVFFFSLFLLKIVRRSLLVTLGVAIWFLLRLLGLRDWYYPALLIPIIISLEILFGKR
jgi:hypothetical protein